MSVEPVTTALRISVPQGENVPATGGARGALRLGAQRASLMAFGLEIGDGAPDLAGRRVEWP